ncbi:hypothetical protein PS880_06309 [Pseudomonas fluorescens]|uniref:Uncharacterized protein n=1 Tax=Pseudomonas fluorescens TaxID=294 RepID=A0A5E7QHT3_PSEFL|nr:hypothetical protein PS880_06309 [Pseudomonas fluorescens]
MELDLHPTIFIAVNLFSRGAGDPRRLADQRGTSQQRWTVKHVPGNGTEAVAVTLGEVLFSLHLASDGFLQHLRLLALVLHAEQQPQIIKRWARVFH